MREHDPRDIYHTTLYDDMYVYIHLNAFFKSESVKERV